MPIVVEATKDAPWKNVDRHGCRAAAEAGVDASLWDCHLSAMSIWPAYYLFMLLLIICGEIGKDAGIEPYAHLSIR